MNKTVLLIITVALIVGIGIIVLSDSKSNTGTGSTQPVQNVEIRDGIQYVTINAKGGYFPRVSSAQAGMQTKLVVKTEGTYDCSTSLVIHSVGYRKNLPQTGEEIIDIGIPEAGTSVRGTCSMGMYNFVVTFG